MKKTVYKAFLILLVFPFFCFSCDTGKTTGEIDLPEETDKPRIQAPAFNADTAYQYIEKQLSFGTRVPNSEAHRQCGLYLEEALKSLGTEVQIQELEIRAYNGTLLKGKNIIASIFPEQKKRILLAAHWDTRPFADQEANDSETRHKPIDGANDGASGVAVLFEVLRTIQNAPNKPNVGIDVILFDLEDYGKPSGIISQDVNTYCLGSQYWSKNPHKPNYTAYYGILLDMVGAKDATFYMEGTSMDYAANITKKVWKEAQRSGFGNYFMAVPVSPITDDHYYVNKNTAIPMIDIIDYDQNGFNKTWHTHDDNIQVISKETLRAVGQTVLQVLYNENPPAS